MKTLIAAAALSLAATAAQSAGYKPIENVPAANGIFVGEVDVTSGFGTQSIGTISIAGHLLDYQSGDGNKIAILPSNNNFVWTGSGPKPGMTCAFSASGNAIPGGGYLAVGTGRSLACTARVGNGGQARTAPATLTFEAE